MIAILVVIVLYFLAFTSLNKANKYYNENDTENFEKWKKINTAMLIAEWVSPIVIMLILIAIING